MKATYIPTNTNTFIVKEIDSDFVEILIDGEYKVVPVTEIRIIDSEVNSVSFDQFNQCLLSSLIVKPSSDLLYSSNTNRLTPEPHQYKPLIKFLNSQNNRLLLADEVGLGKTIDYFKNIIDNKEIDLLTEKTVKYQKKTMPQLT